MTTLYVDSSTGSNANAGTSSASPKATVFLTTGIGAGGNPAFTASSVGDRIVVRRTHLESGSSQYSVSKTGMTLISQCIYIEAHDNSVDSIPSWNSDNTSLKPTIQRLDTTSILGSPTIAFSSAEQKIVFKNLIIKRANSSGLSTGPLFTRTGSDVASHYSFINCNLTLEDNSSTTSDVSNVFQFSSPGGQVYLKSCTVSFPVCFARLTANTTTMGIYAEDTIFDLRVASSESCMVSSTTNEVPMNLTLRRCSLAGGSSALSNLLRNDTAPTTGYTFAHTIITENCTGLPAIGSALYSFDNFSFDTYDRNGGIVYAGLDADPDKHEYLASSYKIVRDTTSSELRLGGSTSVQRLNFAAFSGNPWGHAISFEKPFHRQVGNWLFKMDASNICKCSLYIKAKSFASPPVISGLSTNLYFSVEYISSPISPFTISKEYSYDSVYTSSTLAENAWTELFAELAIPPAEINGFMRIRLFANMFDVGGLLYIEPDVVLTT